MHVEPNSKSGLPYRVYFVDDHPLVREWLASLVAMEKDFVVCGQADDVAAALAAVPLVHPDVMVVDISLPRSSGLELIEQMHRQFPDVRVLVFSMHDEAEIAARAFQLGAHGYAIKKDTGPEIIAGLRAVLSGEFHSSPALNAQLVGRRFPQIGSRKSPPEEILSDRELAVFRLRGQGLATKDISAQLKVSVKTIGSFDARIKEKLGLSDAGELMRDAVLWYARQSGL